MIDRVTFFYQTIEMKLLVLLLGIVGVILFALAFIYFTTPANSLPSFLPGFDPLSTKVHFKHGVGVTFLGLGCFVLAWFQMGKKSS